MSNRASKIAGPMLAKRDANGNARKPAAPEQVVATLYAARVSNCVVREWENEAARRNGVPGTSEIVGRDYRDIQRARRRSPDVDGREIP